MYVRVRAHPGAKKELLTRISETEFEIHVREPAERNLANGRIRTLLAQACGAREKGVQLVSGHRSSTKVFTIEEHSR